MSINAALWEEVKRTERGLSGGGPQSPLAVELRRPRALKGERLRSAVSDIGGSLHGHGSRGWTVLRVPASQAPMLAMLPGVGEVRLSREQRHRLGRSLAMAASVVLVAGAGLGWSALHQVWPFETEVPVVEDREIIWDKQSPRPDDIHGEIKVAGLESFKARSAQPAKPAKPTRLSTATPPGVAAKRAEGEDRPSAGGTRQQPGPVPAAPSTTRPPAAADIAALPRSPSAAPPASASPPSKEIAEQFQHLSQAGLRAYYRGDLKVAVVHWRRALAIQPKQVALRRSLGLALYEMGLHKEAVAEFTAILRAHPEDREAQATLELIQREARENQAKPEGS